jgi:hypothetical protein
MAANFFRQTNKLIDANVIGPASVHDWSCAVSEFVSLYLLPALSREKVQVSGALIRMPRHRRRRIMQRDKARLI